MNRRTFHAAALAIFLTAITRARSLRTPEPRPDPAPVKVLFLLIDDLGKALLASAIAAGYAPNLALAMANALVFDVFLAAPSCTLARTRWLLGLEAVRSFIGSNVMPTTSPPFAGPVDPWITSGMPGTKVYRGKPHIMNAPHWPAGMVGPGRFDAFSGCEGNLNWTLGGSYFHWNKGTADASGSSSAWTSKFATNDLIDDALLDIAAGVDFLSINPNAIHLPLSIPPPNDGQPIPPPGSDPKLAYLAHLDHRLGELFTAALDAGYLIMVGCDNGTAGDGKLTYLDSGIVTPFFAMGAGVPIGQSSRLIQATDLFATIRRLRGAPAHPTLDAVDFTDEILPAWPAIDPPRQVVTCSSYTGPLGSPPAPGTVSRVARGKRFKLTDAQGVEKLVDLLADPAEAVNLLASPPLSRAAATAYSRLKASLP